MPACWYDFDPAKAVLSEMFPASDPPPTHDFCTMHIHTNIFPDNMHRTTFLKAVYPLCQTPPPFLISHVAADGDFSCYLPI